MPMTAFVMFVNDYGTTLRANYVAGDATVKMAAGSGAALLAALAENTNPPPSLARPVRFTLRPIPFTNRSQSLVIQSSGLDGDDLQDCFAVEGTDRNYNAGSLCEFDITAGMLEKLAGAINAIESDATIVRTTMQLDNPPLVHTLDGAKLSGLIDPARIPTLPYQPIGSYQPADPDLSDIAAIAPTKGRLLVGDGTHWQPIGVGTDTYVLTSDAAQALGVKWASPAGGGGGGMAVGGAVAGWAGHGILFTTDAGLLAQSSTYFNFDSVNGLFNTPALNVVFGNVTANGTNFDLVLNGVATAGANAHPNFRVGNAALATTAVDGFLYVPTCPGVPTGTPTAYVGLAALVVDSTTGRVYSNTGTGGWR